MAEKTTVYFKVVINVGHVNEVGWYGINRDVVPSYTCFREELQTVFPSLNETKFTVAWKDSDGDKIIISNDKELIIAVSEMQSGVRKMYVTVQAASDCINMGQEQTVSFQVYLQYMYVTKVRRFDIHRDVVSSFTRFTEELLNVFPSLHERNFTVSWRDSDCYDIIISNDKELIIALSEMPSGVRKLYITVEAPMYYTNMSQEPTVSFKAFLQNAGVNKVRRFDIHRDEVPSFTRLTEKLLTVFPSLHERNFTVSWKDCDGDEIIISDDKELKIALSEQQSEVRKLYITVQDGLAQLHVAVASACIKIGQEQTVSFKAFLQNDGVNIVRRFGINLDEISSLSRLTEELQTVFPSLHERNFTVAWKDSDGDEIIISNDKDLIAALFELQSKFFKLYITVRDSLA